MTGSSADADGRGLLVSLDARAAMRVLRPTVWLVLQDVALDAVYRDGRLVASTSARLVATHLRIDPSTAASALRTLRDRGVVELSQISGPDGRFGLATYTLNLPEGIDALRPCTEPPYTEKPDTGTARRDEDLVFSCPWGDVAAVPSPERGSSCTVESRLGTAHRGASEHGGPAAGVEVSPLQPDQLRTAGQRVVDAHTEPDLAPSQLARRRSSTTVPVEQGAFDLGSGAR